MFPYLPEALSSNDCTDSPFNTIPLSAADLVLLGPMGRRTSSEASLSCQHQMLRFCSQQQTRLYSAPGSAQNSETDVVKILRKLCR